MALCLVILSSGHLTLRLGFVESFPGLRDFTGYVDFFVIKLLCLAWLFFFFLVLVTAGLNSECFDGRSSQVLSPAPELV